VFFGLSVHVSMTESMFTKYLISCLREFTDFTSSVQLGTKMNWFDFEVKSSGSLRDTKALGRHFFVSLECMEIF